MVNQIEAMRGGAPMSSAQGALSPAAAAGVYTQPQAAAAPAPQAETPPPKASLVPKDSIQGSASDVSGPADGGRDPAVPRAR